jgi:hypothetical protein
MEADRLLRRIVLLSPRVSNESATAESAMVTRAFCRYKASGIATAAASSSVRSATFLLISASGAQFPFVSVIVQLLCFFPGAEDSFERPAL